MADEKKDHPADHPDQQAEDVSGNPDNSGKSDHAEGWTGADLPAKAQPLPNEAGTIDPAAEVEARAKAGRPPEDMVKTEAKDEEALPGVEKPSKTLVMEGASRTGRPETAEKAPTPRPQEGAASAKPSPPRAPSSDRPSPPRVAPAAGHKPTAPVRKAPEITKEITGDPFIDQIKGRFGGAITEAVATLNQQILRVNKESYVELCHYLRHNEEFPFDMCTDLTAIHWPERAGQEFDVVLMLYCLSKNRRLRIKVAVADHSPCPSVTAIWAGADWMEREVFDLFGLTFEGHPDLRRILMPADWPGHPLRKEYPIGYQDNEWTDKHLQYREIDYDTDLIDVKYAERR